MQPKPTVLRQKIKLLERERKRKNEIFYCKINKPPCFYNIIRIFLVLRRPWPCSTTTSIDPRMAYSPQYPPILIAFEIKRIYRLKWPIDSM